MDDSAGSVTELEVAFNVDESRFVATLGGSKVGFIDVRRDGELWSLVHTEVDRDHKGGGVGSALVKGALDFVRASGGKVRPSCPFVAAYLQRHPEQHDVVNPDDLKRVRA